MSISRRTWLIVGLAAAAGAWLAFNLWSLERYPTVSCDEAFYGRYALRFVEALAAGEVWPPPGALFFLAYGRTYWLILGSALVQFGPHLAVGRLLSVLGWGLTALATYWLGRRYTGSARAGLWAAALVAVSWTGLWPAHFTRPDILAVAATTALLALMHLAWKHPSWWLNVLLGVATVASLDLHSIAVVIAAPVALVVAVRCLRTRSFASLGWFALGLALGGLAFLWPRVGDVSGPVVRLLISQPLEFLRTQNLAAGISTSGLPFFARLARSLGWLAGFWWYFYLWYTPWFSLPFGLLFLGSLIWALVDSRSGELRTLVLIALISNLLFAAVGAGYTTPVGYAMLWLPLYAVLGVGAIQRLAAWLAPRLPPARLRSLPLAPVILAVYVLAYAAGTLYLAAAHPGGAYDEGAARITAQMEPGSRVLAPSTWWYALAADYELVDENLLEPVNSILWWNASPDERDYDLPEVAYSAPSRLSAAQAQARVTELLEGPLRPDYIVDDGRMGCLIDETPLATALSEYAVQACARVRTVDAGLYGTQTVYECR